MDGECPLIAERMCSNVPCRKAKLLMAAFDPFLPLGPEGSEQSNAVMDAVEIESRNPSNQREHHENGSMPTPQYYETSNQVCGDEKQKNWKGRDAPDEGRTPARAGNVG
jgi:hypothetical protein